MAIYKMTWIRKGILVIFNIFCFCFLEILFLFYFKSLCHYYIGPLPFRGKKHFSFQCILHWNVRSYWCILHWNVRCIEMKLEMLMCMYELLKLTDNMEKNCKTFKINPLTWQLFSKGLNSGPLILVFVSLNNAVLYYVEQLLLFSQLYVLYKYRERNDWSLLGFKSLISVNNLDIIILCHVTPLSHTHPVTTACSLKIHITEN